MQAGSVFRCPGCDETHEGPPRAYFVAEPAGWDVTRDRTSRRRGELFEEQAILHGPGGEEGSFVRGNIEIPLHEARLNEPPYFGWLTAELPGYPSTLNLKTNVHSRPHRAASRADRCHATSHARRSGRIQAVRARSSAG